MLRRRDRVVVTNTVGDGCCRLPNKGRAPGEKFVQRHTKSIDIGTRPDLGRIAELLRCHVGGCSNWCLCDRRVGNQLFDKTEVHNLGLAIRGEKHIVGLNVAMNVTMFVKIVGTLGKFLDHLGNAMKVPAVDVSHLLQRSTFKVFHHQIQLALVLPGIVNRHDVGVDEAGRCLDLPQESPNCLWVKCVVGVDEFYGNDAFMKPMLGLVVSGGASN